LFTKACITLLRQRTSSGIKEPIQSS